MRQKLQIFVSHKKLESFVIAKDKNVLIDKNSFRKLIFCLSQMNWTKIGNHVNKTKTVVCPKDVNALVTLIIKIRTKNNIPILEQEEPKFFGQAN